jgi:hypothetical protein
VHFSNHYYGHADLLARYCGEPVIERAPRIRGVVQHGWNIGDGIGPTKTVPPGMPVFLWSEEVRRRAWSMGRRNAVVTGAPWAYLLTLEPEPDGLERTGTIWYPFHGWEKQKVTGDHSELIRTIRAVEGDEQVTVCLYWQEYKTEPIRELYERAGFRVVCHGWRGEHWAKREPEFLYRQLAELRRHRRVASNRLSTAIFYGASVGCEIAVYGDPMVLEGEDQATGGQQRITRQWPELLGERVDPVVSAAGAVRELGMDRLLSAPELRELFGWSREAWA